MGKRMLQIRGDGGSAQLRAGSAVRRGPDEEDDQDSKKVDFIEGSKKGNDIGDQTTP